MLKLQGENKLNFDEMTMTAKYVLNQYA